MNRRIGLLIGIGLAVSAIAAPATINARQPDTTRAFDGRQVTTRSENQTPSLRHASFTSAESVLGGAPTADIEVSYTGFTPDAQTAFEAAVNVWEHTLVSSQVIHVDATWTALPTNVLGSAGPTFIRLQNGFWYPIALAEAKCSCERTSDAEIEATFSSAFSDWYFGTDGDTPLNKVDFLTVVLHELGHGLGFISSFSVGGGKGFWGYSSSGTIYPFKFDSYERTAATGGNSLISDFNNPSVALKTELTDGSVFFDGPNAVAAAGGRVKLFAPGPWQPGSSNSHVDDATFSGTPEGLMTPAIADGEALHVPGPVTVAMMQDIGWEVATPDGGGAPDNDNLGDATTASLNSVSTATTTEATFELDEPQPACSTAVDKTVWYQFTPGRNRTVVANTVGSDFDTVLAVYTAADPVELATLTPVACSDNRLVDNLSRLKLTLTGGTTYYFQAGGANGEAGNLTFRLKKP